MGSTPSRPIPGAVTDLIPGNLMKNIIQIGRDMKPDMRGAESGYSTRKLCGILEGYKQVGRYISMEIIN